MNIKLKKMADISLVTRGLLKGKQDLLPNVVLMR